MTTCIKCFDYESDSWKCYSVTNEDGEHWFDVDAAIRLVADGREKILMPAEMLVPMVAVNVINQAHVWHVDPDKPGIIAFREWGDGGFFFIDGSHRAARCVAEKRPFYVFAIDAKEIYKIRIPNPRKMGAITTEEAHEMLKGIAGEGLVE